MSEHVFFNRTVGTFRTVGIIEQDGYKQDVIIESMTAGEVMALTTERDELRYEKDCANEELGTRLAAILELTAERDALLSACEATMEALDGLYGADHSEPIPHAILTPDRKAAFNRALEQVAAALALVEAKE